MILTAEQYNRIEFDDISPESAVDQIEGSEILNVEKATDGENITGIDLLLRKNGTVFMLYIGVDPDERDFITMVAEIG